METVIVRAAPDAGDALERWVEEPLVALVARLREALPAAGDGDAADPARVAVVVELPPAAAGEDPWRLAARDALCEAVRGVVGTLTLELGPVARVNTLLAHEADGAAARAALAFLAGPRAGFVAGATFDLREQAA